MKDTIKNSIIGGFAVFGFLCLFTAQSGTFYPTSTDPTKKYNPYNYMKKETKNSDWDEEFTNAVKDEEQQVAAVNNPSNAQGRFQISTEYDPTGKILMEVIFDTKLARVIQRRRVKVYDWSIQAPSYKNINGNITIR